MTNLTTQYTVFKPITVQYEIKKSRFIGLIIPSTSEAEAVRQLQTLAAQHPHANHLAFAWRIRQADGFINERCHDAGEPSGTAGRPILAPLEGQSIINTVVGVIRYFGGVKLGTGGLTRAYGTTAKLAIDAATLNPWVEMVILKLDIEYSRLQTLEYQLNKCHGQIIEQQFTDRVHVTINLPARAGLQIQQQFTDF
ncbi:MAG: putative YigZ family protein [Methylophagaceae bacterium]|jgi:uncharacterized YigZ family protein